jgi:hypothetical protein
MPLDTRIALGAQPLQIESPLAQYGQAVGIQNAMQQNQLGQMQMSAAQRAMQEEEGAKNFLSGNPDLSTPENQRRLLAFGKTGLGYAKAIAEQKKAGLEGDKLSSEIFGLTQKSFLQANSPITAAASEKGVEDFIRATYAHPVLGALAKEIKPLDQAIAENIAMYRRDPDQWTAAHLNLDAKSAIDAVTAARERANEAKRIASLPPLPGAVPTGTVDATNAALAVPGAQQVEARPVAAAGNLVPVALNALAPAAAAGNVNAMTGNDATLQAMAAARKPIEDRLGILNRLPYSKGVEIEVKRLEAQLKELNAQVNLRPDGSAITPYGVLTAAAAPSDILRLQREEADLRAAGKTKEADVIADQIKVKNQLRDDRDAMEKLVDAEIAARKAGQIRKAEDLADQIKVKNQSIDITTMKALGYPITKEGFKAFKDAQRQEKAKSEFEQLLDDAGMTEAQKKKARAERIKKESSFAPPISIENKVNAYMPASEEAQRDFIRSTRATYDTLKNAPGTLKNIEEAIKLIPNAKGFMGPGGESLLDAASFLNSRLGTSINTKGITDATELRSRLFQGIIENLRKLDANPTENQQNAMRVALGNIGTDPNALPAVLNSFADTVRAKVDAHNAEVNSAVTRGVKFPYDPTIKLPSFTPSAPSGAELIPTGKSAAGAGGWKVIK